MIHKGKKLNHSQIMNLEKKQAFEILEQSKSDNWGVVVCSVTGMTIYNPSKTNVAHIVSKGALCAARFDFDNLVLVKKSIHDIMDCQGGKEWEEIKEKLCPEIKASPEAMQKVKEFFEDLPYRIELIKSRYSKVIK